jgi:nuclear pore complex protein Nup205
MAELNSLENLQALYLDLLALSESRLSNVDRLEAQLNAHIEDFKNLLNKKPRNGQSRKSLSTGTRRHRENTLAPTNLDSGRETRCFWR